MIIKLGVAPRSTQEIPKFTFYRSFPIEVREQPKHCLEMLYRL